MFTPTNSFFVILVLIFFNQNFIKITQNLIKELDTYKAKIGQGL